MTPEEIETRRIEKLVMSPEEVAAISIVTDIKVKPMEGAEPASDNKSGE